MDFFSVYFDNKNVDTRFLQKCKQLIFLIVINFYVKKMFCCLHVTLSLLIFFRINFIAIIAKASLMIIDYIEIAITTAINYVLLISFLYSTLPQFNASVKLHVVIISSRVQRNSRYPQKHDVIIRTLLFVVHTITGHQYCLDLSG